MKKFKAFLVSLTVFIASAITTLAATAQDGGGITNPSSSPGLGINGICATSVAYAIVKTNLDPSYEIASVMRELAGAETGNVQLIDLAEFLQGKGFATRVLRGLNVSDLNTISPHGEMHVMPLTSSGESTGEDRIDHVSMFLRMSSDGSAVFADSGRLVRLDSPSLEVRWGEGYALIASLDEELIEQWLKSRDDNSPRHLMLSAAGVALLSLFTWMLWRRRRPCIGRCIVSIPA